VMIIVDSLRADHVGAYGDARGLTPNIDSVAQDGLVFERAYATAPWTLPAVGSIFTGRLPHAHELGRDRSGGEPEEMRFRRLNPDIPTLAERMAKAELHTSFVGSSRLLHPAYNLDRGFDRYENWTGARYAFLVPYALLHLTGDVDHSYISAKRQAGRALRVLKLHPNDPLFLVAHFQDPHRPWAPRAGNIRGLSGGQRKDPTMSRYPQEVAFADRHIGRVLDELRASGRYDNSWIIIVADHGEELTEDRARPQFLRFPIGHGHALTEEEIHIPLIIKAPADNGQPAGRRSDPVSQVDIMPTLLKAFDPDFPYAGSGRDLMAYTSDRADRMVMIEAPMWGPEQVAVRAGDLKLLCRSNTAPALELYDLQADPDELHPMALGDAHQTLREFLYTHHPDPPCGPNMRAAPD